MRSSMRGSSALALERDRQVGEPVALARTPPRPSAAGSRTASPPRTPFAGRPTPAARAEVGWATTARRSAGTACSAPLPPRERCGVGAGRLPAGRARAAEEAVRGRRRGGAERGVADHAAGLARLAAERDVREVAADVGVPRAPGSSCRAASRTPGGRAAAGCGSISFWMQRGQTAGALRVPDQHHAAAAVVVGDVVLPRVDHVGVGQRSVDRDRLAAAGSRAARSASPGDRRARTRDTPIPAARPAGGRRTAPGRRRGRDRCCRRGRSRWSDRRRSSRSSGCAPDASARRASCRSP